jgi:hypothetical protein
MRMSAIRIFPSLMMLMFLIKVLSAMEDQALMVWSIKVLYRAVKPGIHESETG